MAPPPVLAGEVCKRRANCLKPQIIARCAPLMASVSPCPRRSLRVKVFDRVWLPYDAIMTLDSETKAVELPEDHAEELRLWLRLLTCTTLIEGEIRSRLRERFDVTLPRFDLMAQLDKAPDGMTLSDVSKRMMVSNGNVTGLVSRITCTR